MAWPLGLAAVVLYLVGGSPDSIWAAAWPWAENIGLRASFNIDGLSQLFLLLILGIGFGVQVFAVAYFRSKPESWQRYWVPMFVFIFAMVGAVTADNLLFLFLFWELTSLSSFFLIGMDRERPSARHSAQMALIVTGAGGLCLLAGSLLLGQAAGTYEISQILLRSDELRGHAWMDAIFVLFALGAFTKSAQFPFHFWLPNAMAAPAPVSAYLHSATMVKLGVYLLARFYPLFSALPLWSWLLIGCGGITFVWGAWVALHKTDLKTSLANTTVSGLGLLVLCLGVGTPVALIAGLVFLVTHAFYKAPLFLMTGVIEKKLGTRDLRELQNLGFKIPALTIGVCLAAASMAGFPPWIGFVAKEVLLDAAWNANAFVLAAALLGSVLTIATAFRIGYKPFWGSGAAAVDLKVAPKYNFLPTVPLVFALVGTLSGLFVGRLGEIWIDPALVAMGSARTLSDLSLWHGWNMAVFLGIGSWIFGFLIYRYHPMIETFGSRHFFEGDGAYEFLLRGTLGLGARLTQSLQNGSLPFYLSVTIAATVSMGILSFWVSPLDFSGQSTDWTQGIDATQVWGILLCLLMMAMATLSLVTTYALTAILGMGGVGFSVAVFFGFFGAPDLALTQFSVECLALLLFVLLLPSMPAFSAKNFHWRRRVQSLICLVAGLTIFITVWAGLIKGSQSRLTPYFAQNSWLEAHGRNVVNVILVDFRGLDTMGEITVLVIAALGVAVLVGGRRKKGAA